MDRRRWTASSSTSKYSVCLCSPTTDSTDADRRRVIPCLGVNRNAESFLIRVARRRSSGVASAGVTSVLEVPQPSVPATPAVPSEPVTPAVPSEPVTPAVPDAPVVPADPDPGSPADPAEPAEVPQPAEGQ